MSHACRSTGSRDILELALKTAKEDTEEEGGRGLDMEDVLSQVKTFLFAGHGELGGHAVAREVFVCPHRRLCFRMMCAGQHVGNARFL